MSDQESKTNTEGDIMKKAIWDVVPKSRGLKDGMYTVPNTTEVVYLARDDRFDEGQIARFEELAAKYPNYRVGHAYETYNPLFFSEPPIPFKFKCIGSSGQGACILIEDCPSRLLILTEND
jgi:hypothetical protein